MKTAKTKPFNLDLNLDDKEEVDSFISSYGKVESNIIAERLGLHGEGSIKLADALLNYAWNKRDAIFCRENGDIESAIQYEIICDSIYSKNINPVLNAW